MDRRDFLKAIPAVAIPGAALAAQKPEPKKYDLVSHDLEVFELWVDGKQCGELRTVCDFVFNWGRSEVVKFDSDGTRSRDLTIEATIVRRDLTLDQGKTLANSLWQRILDGDTITFECSFGLPIRGVPVVKYTGTLRGIGSHHGYMETFDTKSEWAVMEYTGHIDGLAV